MDDQKAGPMQPTHEAPADITANLRTTDAQVNAPTDAQADTQTDVQIDDPADAQTDVQVADPTDAQTDADTQDVHADEPDTDAHTHADEAPDMCEADAPHTSDNDSQAQDTLLDDEAAQVQDEVQTQAEVQGEVQNQGEVQDEPHDTSRAAHHKHAADDPISKSTSTLQTLNRIPFVNLTDHTRAQARKERRAHKKVQKHKFSVLITILKCVIAACVVCGIAFTGYAAYLESYYKRIVDPYICKIDDPTSGDTTTQPKQVEWNTTYTATTYNVGFGAYTPSYTFFMDKGAMNDGTQTQGTYGKARSKQAVIDATNTSLETIRTSNNGKTPDFLLFQEIDVQSDRSYQVNQVEEAKKMFSSYNSTFASNFHSGFLIYPLHDMHGAVQSGLLSMSAIDITNATRYSYPVSTKFPDKFFDLDRCFQVTRYRTPDNHELVMINSHMSAYDANGEYRAKQLNVLNNFLTEERAKGNYVIAGGDWNHALGGSISAYPSQQQIPSWVAELNDSDLAEGFRYVAPDNLSDTPTCRGDDIPYQKGVTYTTTVDGFMVSDNIDAHATNIDTEFASSDHNPVLLRFTLIHQGK